MAVNRWFRKRHGRDPEAVPAGWWPRTWRVLLTLHFIVVARILFRAEDFGTSWVYLQGLWDATLLMPRFSLMALMIMALGFAIHFSPDRWQVWAEGLFAGEATEGAPALQVRLASRLMSGSWAPVCWALALSLAAVACLGLGTGEQLSFIYYSF